jgi:hypothetical protein
LNSSTLDQNLYNEWLYKGNDNPEPSTERVHINFWLMSGLDPKEGQEMEIIIEEFQFIPNNCTQYEEKGIDAYNIMPLSIISSTSIIPIMIWIKRKMKIKK